MSKIKDALGEDDFKEKEDTFTDKQEAFFKEEGFSWSEYTGWNFETKKDDYNIWIDARVHYFTLYIYKGEFIGETELEETFFYYSDEAFYSEYENILEKIKKFFS